MIQYMEGFFSARRRQKKKGESEPSVAKDN